MVLNLKFIKQSASGQARLYENAGGARQWIPRSVCPNMFKHPPVAGQLTVHEVTVEDWWCERNPWPDGKQKQLL